MVFSSSTRFSFVTGSPVTNARPCGELSLAEEMTRPTMPSGGGMDLEQAAYPAGRLVVHVRDDHVEEARLV